MPHTIQELEAAVSQLTLEELADFRAWFAEFEGRHSEQQATSLAEQAAWHRLAAQNLSSAYGDDEPEYTVADLQKTNPAYRAS